MIISKVTKNQGSLKIYSFEKITRGGGEIDLLPAFFRVKVH